MRETPIHVDCQTATVLRAHPITGHRYFYCRTCDEALYPLDEDLAWQRPEPPSFEALAALSRGEVAQV